MRIQYGQILTLVALCVAAKGSSIEDALVNIAKVNVYKSCGGLFLIVQMHNLHIWAGLELVSKELNHLAAILHMFMPAV